jgi:hypothetical protein
MPVPSPQCVFPIETGTFWSGAKILASGDERFLRDTLDQDFSGRTQGGIKPLWSAGSAKSQRQVPAGSVLLMRMLGRDRIELFEKHIPSETF